MLVIFFNRTFAQNESVIPPSPNSSSLGKYIDNPVSYHTGIPNIVIPFYTIKLKDFDLPIDLNYHAGGIKVEEIASSVGLGWSLNAGGMITRVVKDIPDDYRYDNREDEEYSFRAGGAIVNAWPKTSWGYLFAIPEGVPDLVNTRGYKGTDTYKFNFDEIYNNRYNYLPEKAYLSNFFFPLYDLYQVSNDGERFYTMSCKQFADLEPDIFYYNFAGKSGKFVFEVKKGQPTVIRTIPYQNWDIQHFTDPTSGRLSKFVVTDDSGLKYFFENTETTRNVITYDGFKNADYTTYNSSWYLSRIETPRNEYLKFNYAIETQIHTFPVPMGASIERLRRSLSNPMYYYDRFVNEGNKNRVTACRLTSIENEDVKVVFEADHIREDAHNYFGYMYFESEASGFFGRPLAIDGIAVYSKTNDNLKRLKRFKLDYDYFLNDGDPYKGKHGKVDDFKNRLRLKSIQEFGDDNLYTHPKTLFTYKYFDYTGNNAHILPSRYTHNQDIWGYYNGANNVNTSIPKLHVYPDSYAKGDARMFSVYPKENIVGSYFVVPGADRMPNTDFMDIGVLTRITYPTGGYTNYEYESHRYIDEGKEFIGGGLRIKKISKNDNSSLESIEYKYERDFNGTIRSSGKIVSKPFFAFMNNTNEYYTNDGSIAHRDSLIKRLMQRFNTPQGPMGTTAGSNVGYTNVAEFKSGNGKTEYTYSFPAPFGEDDDAVPTDGSAISDNLYRSTVIHNVFMYGVDKPNYDLSYFPSITTSYPFPSNPNYDWNRGLLLSSTVYAENGKKLKKTMFEYSNYYPDNKTKPTPVYGLKQGSFFFNDKNGVFLPFNGRKEAIAFRVGNYEVLTDVAKVVKNKIEIEYDPVSAAELSRRTITTKYNGKFHYQPSEEISKNSLNDDHIVKYKYPSDYSFIKGHWLEKMHTKRLMNIPIESSVFIKQGGVEKVIKSQFVNYCAVGDVLLPDKISQLSTPERANDFQMSFNGVNMDRYYEENQCFLEYDAKFNPIKISRNGVDLFTSYIWGYNGQYPIAEVKNAAPSDIAYTSFESGNNLGGWKVYGIGVLSKDAPDAPTGNKVFSLVPDEEIPSIYKPNLTIGKSYVVSYWLKNGGFASVESGAAYNAEKYISIGGISTNGWRQYHCVINALSSTSIVIMGNGLIDELRLYPVDAKMTTYTYLPLIGMTTQTDSRGIISYYEYDHFQRLRNIKDHEGNIIKSFDYHYKP